MKAKRYLLIAVFLGVVMGWILGYLRLPYLDKNYAFLLGFIACLACVAFGLILFIVSNRLSLVSRQTEGDMTALRATEVRRTNLILWSLAAIFIICAGLAGGYFIYKQSRLLTAEMRDHNAKIRQQSELMQSAQNSSLVVLMNNLLNKVDDEISGPQKTLTDETIARISALSYSFKPYRYLNGDSLTQKKQSPERGQLLLALIHMNIDSVTVYKIMQGTTFASADLERAPLQGVNMRYADLRGANLRNAMLDRADLQEADLSEADLWGARLSDANLWRANLRRATMEWAVLDHINLDSAQLDGVRLNSAKVTFGQLRGADLQWSYLDGADLRSADFSGANFSGVSFQKADLSNATLEEANFGLATFIESNLDGADLNRVTVSDSAWMSNLTGWQVTGAMTIQEKYMLVRDTSALYGLRILTRDN